MSQCSTWACSNNRCRETAVWWVCSPEGQRISYHCGAHAVAIVQEYREKLGEYWTLEPHVDPALRSQRKEASTYDEYPYR